MELSPSFGSFPTRVTWLPCDAGIRGQKLGILHLPEHILSKILGLLGPAFLLTARLTCKAFQAASIPCITSVIVDCLGWSGRGRVRYLATIAPKLLHQRLQVFSSIRHLELVLRQVEDEVALRIRAVLSTCKSLSIPPGNPILQNFSKQLPAVLPLFLRASTSLTSLEVDTMDLTPDGVRSFASGIRACCNLQELILWFSPRDADVETDLAEAVLDISSLQTLIERRYWKADIFWRHVMVNAGRLPALRSLAGVRFDKEEEPTLLRALSQLTHLGFSEFPAWLVRHISGLPALRSLHDVSRGGALAVTEGVRPLVQMQELVVRESWREDGRFSLEEVTRLLAALPSLTKLGVSVSAPAMPPIPHAFSADGFAGLRSLSMELAADVASDHVEALAARLTGLESLEMRGSVRLCASLLSSLPPLPRLTELTADADEFPLEVFSASGRFLAGLPRLRSLCLVNVLNVVSWDEEGRHINKLTDLTNLRVVLRCPEHTFLEREQVHLQAPVPLWRLKHWDFESCPCVTPAAWSQVLGEAGEDLRHVMGLPRRPENFPERRVWRR
jgi:hypothetical protein